MLYTPVAEIPTLSGACRRRLAALLLTLVAALGSPVSAADNTGRAPIKILALGDSLTAGHGLVQADSFPAQLQKALQAKGYHVRVINAGVSGDTTSDGLARLDWVLAAKPDAVIVELGANDALRGIDPAVTRANLDKILHTLHQRGLPVLLAGMLAPPNLGKAYADQFDPIYPALAVKYDTVLYPFFLDGVATRPALNQPDGMHPNARGVKVVVQHILPAVEKLLARVQDKAGKQSP